MFVSVEEFGQDLEHVEVLQRKFDEFQKDMAAQEYRVTEVNELAERLVLEGHPERETIVKRKDVSLFIYFAKQHKKKYIAIKAIKKEENAYWYRYIGKLWNCGKDMWKISTYPEHVYL